jgi:hypothetical protein
VESNENIIRQGSTHDQDAKQISILAGGGASIGGIADRSWKGAGIGAGIGSGVGLATVLLSRGKEVDLKQGTTLDVVFDRPQHQCSCRFQVLALAQEWENASAHSKTPQQYIGAGFELVAPSRRVYSQIPLVHLLPAHPDRHGSGFS